jgi:hypothetical protein
MKLLLFRLKEVDVDGKLRMRLAQAFKHLLVDINSLDEIFAVQAGIEWNKLNRLKALGQLVKKREVCELDNRHGRGGLRLRPAMAPSCVRGSTSLGCLCGYLGDYSLNSVLEAGKGSSTLT